MSDADRLEAAYRFAARHRAREFRTAAVVDQDKLRLYAARGLIGTGIHTPSDIDKVTDLLETRGIEFRGEHVALVMGLSGDRVRVTNTAQVRIEQVRIEQELAASAERAARDRSNALSAQAVEAAIARSDLDFTGDHGRAQLAAIRARGTGGALTLLTGVAGAGKTALLRPLVDAWKEDGRTVYGISTAWRQADALKGADIAITAAVAPFLGKVDNGEIALDRNTVLVIDEISQVSPRQMARLLDLQNQSGMIIRALGDREQAQSIEAGDTIEILQRVMSYEASLHLLSTVRQRQARDRSIASMFRGREPEPEELQEHGLKRNSSRRIDGTQRKTSGNADAASEFEARAPYHLDEVRTALAMKREDGTAVMIGGDHDQVLGRIADHYIARREALLAQGNRGGITISALTNDDVADISRAIQAAPA